MRKNGPVIRIIGLDPSLSRTGWGLIEAEGNRLVHVAHGAIATKAGEPLTARLGVLHAALCAEAVGVVDTLMVHTAEHLRTRKQFGAPLAKFQVLQHRMALAYAARAEGLQVRDVIARLVKAVA